LEHISLTIDKTRLPLVYSLMSYTLSYIHNKNKFIIAIRMTNTDTIIWKKSGKTSISTFWHRKRYYWL